MPNGFFYTRVAGGTANGAAVLRGYTLTYPATQKAQFDLISIAIANAFEPFPAPAAPPPPQHGSKLVASALAIGPALAVAVLPGGACPSPQVGTRPARIVRQESATSLALLDVPGLPGPKAGPLPAGAAPQDAADAVVLFEAAPANAAADSAAELVVAVGEIMAPRDAGESPRIAAPLQGPASGAVVFDRSGALVGLVAAVPQMPRLVAGVVPTATYPLVPAAALSQFLGDTARPPTRRRRRAPPAPPPISPLSRRARSCPSPAGSDPEIRMKPPGLAARGHHAHNPPPERPINAELMNRPLRDHKKKPAPRERERRATDPAETERRARRRRLWRIAGTSASVAILVLSLIVLVRTFSTVNYWDLRAAIQATRSRPDPARLSVHRALLSCPDRL